MKKQMRTTRVYTSPGRATPGSSNLLLGPMVDANVGPPAFISPEFPKEIGGTIARNRGLMYKPPGVFAGKISYILEENRKNGRTAGEY